MSEHILMHMFLKKSFLAMSEIKSKNKPKKNRSDTNVAI